LGATGSFDAYDASDFGDVAWFFSHFGALVKDYNGDNNFGFFQGDYASAHHIVHIAGVRSGECVIKSVNKH
jgi:hypothetical protein